MTLTEMALMSRLTRVSMTSCWAAGSPEGGLRKTISTPASAAALVQPDSTVFHNGSGLVLATATLGKLPPARVDLVDELHAGSVARASGRDRSSQIRRERMARCLTFGENDGRSDDGDEDTAKTGRDKGSAGRGRIDGPAGS